MTYIVYMSSYYLFNDSEVNVVWTGTQTEDGLPGLDGGDLAVVARVEGPEGRLVLGLVLQLLLQTHAEDNVARLVEHHLALVQLGHGPKQVERPGVRGEYFANFQMIVERKIAYKQKNTRNSHFKL